MRTKNGLPKHCSWNKDRTKGPKRVRFRKGGVDLYLTGVPWSDEFMKQYADAMQGVIRRLENIGAERTKPGSIDEVIVRYYRSGEFATLKSSTKTVRRNIIENFRKEHGNKPVKLLQRAHVKAMIAAKAKTPSAANNLLKVIRKLLAFAVDDEMIASNVAATVKKLKVHGDGIHTWSEAEIVQFHRRHPVGTKPRLAMDLMLFTGQRRSDVVKAGRQHVDNGMISVTQEKTDERLWVPMHPDLVKSIAAGPAGNMTFLVTAYGRPFTAAGFGNWFREQCNLAALPQCSAHGLRKAAATRLANAGCSTDQIKAITGHRSLSEVQRYTKAADQKRLARQAVDMQLRAEREQELSSTDNLLDKKEAK